MYIEEFYINMYITMRFKSRFLLTNNSVCDMLKNYPPTTQGQWKCPPLVGGPAAVADALTHRGGASHRPWAVGAPARWAGFNFPRVSNLHLPTSV